MDGGRRSLSIIVSLEGKVYSQGLSVGVDSCISGHLQNLEEPWVQVSYGRSMKRFNTVIGWNQRKINNIPWAFCTWLWLPRELFEYACAGEWPPAVDWRNQGVRLRKPGIFSRSRYGVCVFRCDWLSLSIICSCNETWNLWSLSIRHRFRLLITKCKWTRCCNNFYAF